MYVLIEITPTIQLQVIKQELVNNLVTGNFDNNTNGELKLLQKGYQTRRVFIKGNNISELVLILKKRLQVNKSSTIQSGDYGCIYLKNLVKSRTILGILEDSSLDLELYSNKRALKGNSSQNQNTAATTTWIHNVDTNSSSLVSTKRSSNLRNKKSYFEGLLKQQQQQQQRHECNSKDCCLTLIEMVKNSNIKQLLSHICKVIVKNGWCVHQLFNYVDYQVQDAKLNEQIFKILSEKMNDIKNACELGGSLNICRNCQEQRQQQYQQYFLFRQKNSVQQNDIQQQIQPNEVMQQSKYTNSIQQFSLVHQESSLEQPQVQPYITAEKQQNQQLHNNNSSRKENYYINLKQIQDDSIKKHVSLQEVARSWSQSPITKSINNKQ
ncbi:hypothetical protein ABPG72_006228 [Tetrahymena utriculariae]